MIAVSSHEERRAVDLFEDIAARFAMGIYHWTVSEGLKRLDLDVQPPNDPDPRNTLEWIKNQRHDALFLLLDFHPYLDDPLNIRILKDIALYQQTRKTVVFISHQVELPKELQKFGTSFRLSLPSLQEVEKEVRKVANEWSHQNEKAPVRAKSADLQALVKNLKGLSLRDVNRLARTAIYDDGAITDLDIERVQKAKYKLLNQQGVLSFEFDKVDVDKLAGFGRLKEWLRRRTHVLHQNEDDKHLDKPKGVLLLGVQGCGKSLAARAIAGMWRVPLLRLDFGTIYNKYHGETERNLRESLATSEAMAPCVLWMDEIEKGISTGDSDGGTSQRVLGTILTWMAEKKQPVFLVATANDISALPPELVRKGRFDEIFFVDLPQAQVREAIMRIHMEKRDIDPEGFDFKTLLEKSEGYSGAEIEQAVISALFNSHSNGEAMTDRHLIEALENTKPLSVLMAEKIQALRLWAADRTVPSD